MTSSDMKLQCQKVTDFRVRGYNSHITINLPTMYTRKHIPAIIDHIPSYESVKTWPHLSQVANEMSHKLDAPVGLLIGYNCPQAFLPRKCVTGGSSEPFAIKSDLGWMVMGHTVNSKDDGAAFSHRIVSEQIVLPHDPNRKAVTFKASRAPRPQDVLDILQSDFNERTERNSHDMSIEDEMFVSKISADIHQDEHNFVTMPLPLKANPPANNSKAAAVHRFGLLQRKFEKDPAYKMQYTQFMNEILKYGEAEQVLQSELEHDSTWYIPHFGTYHPKKPG